MTTMTNLMKLTAVGLVMASMAACTPKRQPVGAVPDQPTGATNPVYPGSGTGNIGGSNTGAARPGSEQDFVVNVGDRVYFDLDSYQVSSEAYPASGRPGPVASALSADHGPDRGQCRRTRHP
jgi:peptidoglycan-associated lipoprotein